MSLLSHAQNAEDVVLYRALKDLRAGHYIDIGACDPTEYSVTKIFYDLGWTGVNVEPSREHFASLEAERKNDLNLNVAVAARPGILRFHHIPGTGLSTLVDDVASAAQDKGFEAENVDVPVLTLADICRNLPFSTTHFLKIDVEGGEREVLQGADFTTFRPWIIVVEATAPLSTERTDDGWRSILESADYDSVLFDGLNVFFLARERGELRDRLSAPANVLDDYMPTRLIAPAKTERDALAAERGRVEAALEAERTRADAFQAQRDRLDAHVGQITEGLQEARVELRVVRETFERELARLREDGQLEAERHLAELVEAREQLARLAHFKSLSERLRQISDLTCGGAHLEDRGAELLELRAGLLRQADAWQAEVEHLQGRLDEAVTQSDLLQASTSWRVTSPLRGLRRATHVLRREPRRLPGLMRQRARSLLGRPGGPDSSGEASDVAAPTFEAGTRALVAVAARLDGEMALIADLLGSVSSVLGDDASVAAGPFYADARLDEQLTRWVLADVARQRRLAL